MGNSFQIKCCICRRNYADNILHGYYVCGNSECTDIIEAKSRIHNIKHLNEIQRFLKNKVKEVRYG